ncbi:dTDP-4-dehydrorhamnose reductase [Aurantiacibacter aquimixticola]|uniref:dTDP-4-dehydrorhamnose reductase n=1 Tax=Aurantiacibacter aquimixticola TaxID=1958945 RepID=A0A419RUJ4_9SPHN|nr:dTDP-4-dehydrorhamnose reductase [Aurantiacibacter aquimixticola]RJY09452.1 dTDP-4-dehydrorhamnose reductase [Aurantiacibacter aquimixticola]
MNVLLTGADGQLGTALLETQPHGANITGITESDCDFRDPDAIDAALSRYLPDIVINTAAYTAVDAAETDVDCARQINSEAVLAITTSLPGKLVHVSTDFVFDGLQTRPYHPDDARAPLSVYGRTKAEGENHLRAGDLLVRTSWLYSARGRNFVRTMLQLMGREDRLRVVCDQIGGPTWAVSLAETIWGLIAKGASGTFHHCDAGVASWYDFAVAVQEEALGLGILENAIPIVPIASEKFPTAAKRPNFSVLDCSATRTLLEDGHTHWRTNLRRMLQVERGYG